MVVAVISKKKRKRRGINKKKRILTNVKREGNKKIKNGFYQT
jgi:hypothetical protein